MDTYVINKGANMELLLDFLLEDYTSVCIVYFSQYIFQEES